MKNLMTNKSERIAPVFSGDRFHGETIEGYHFKSRGQSYIEVKEGGAHPVKAETLKMSLDNGTTWVTMEEAREALLLSKCFKCGNKNCFMRGNVSRTEECEYEQRN